MIKEIKSNYKLYIFALIISILMFLPCIIDNHGILITYGDPFEISYKLWLGGWTQFHDGNFSQFNWSLGLGANTFSYIFYFLGNPFFWISLILPREFIKYSFLVFAIIQFTLGFIFTHIWLSKITKNPKARLIGAFIMAFGGYGIFYLQVEQFIKVIFFYPLILYFTETFIQEKKFIGLCLSIGLLGISQYFLLYQFIPFLFLYTLFRYLIFNKNNLTLKKTLIKAGIFLLIILLGIGISSIVLLPCAHLILSMPRFSNTIVDLSKTLNLKQLYEIFTSFFTPVMQKLDANAFIATDRFDFMGWCGVTSLYCLIITPILSPLLMVVKDKFVRNIYIIFAMILFVFIFFQFFSYLFQATIDTRWYYMFYLLAIMINTKIIEELDNNVINNKILYITTIFTILIILSALYISYRLYLNNTIILQKLTYSSIIIIILAIIYCISLTKSLHKLLIIALSCEAIYSGYFYYTNNDFIKYWAYDNQVLKNSISADIEDESFHRVLYSPYSTYNEDGTILTLTSSNEPMANDYAGFAFYESIYNTTQEAFLNRFKSSWNMSQLVGRNKIYNMLSAKYFYAYDNLSYPVPIGYELYKEDTNKNLKIYINNYYVELGYTYNKTISKEAIEDLSFFEQDRIMQEYLITESSNNDQYELHDKIELITTLSTNTYREYEFEEPIENVNLYFEVYGIPNTKITTYYNDKIVNQYDFWQFNYIDIPIYEPITKIVIEAEDIYGNGTFINLYKEDLDVDYYNRIENISKNHFENVIFKNDFISGDITIENDNDYIFTSIPYDLGWKVKVNGEYIEYEKVQLGFIGFKLPKGTYHIEFEYSIPLLKEGFLLSTISLVILLFFIIKFIIRKYCK